MDLLYEDITDKIIKAFYNVYNTLGYGFLEKVYENAMMIELSKFNFEIENQKSLLVYYENEIVGTYYADIIVENRIIVELKANELLNPNHECQLLNYLKATEPEVGLLLNFGKKPEFKRKIFQNNRLNL